MGNGQRERYRIVALRIVSEIGERGAVATTTTTTTTSA